MQTLTHGKIKCHHLQNHPKSSQGLSIGGGGNGSAQDDMKSQDWGLLKDDLMAINVEDKGFKDGLLTKANLQTLGSDIMSLATKDIQSWTQGLDRGHDDIKMV